MEVDFCIINDLSLPLCDHKYQEQIINFIQLVSILKSKNINTIRASFDFRELEFFTNSKNLHQVLGQESRDFSIRLKSLITNSITRFESPLIRDDEHVQKEELELNSEYFINDTQCCTGLACADIWGTFCVSFLTSELWESDKIQITKHHIIDDESIVEIPNVSKQEHTLTLNFDQKSKLESVEELFDTLSSQDSQYLLEFSKDAYSDIYALYDTNHSIINRFYDLLSSIKSTPDVGIGKPEKLKEDKSGYLSRRVNLEDRIVYKQVSADTIEIISCKGHYD